MEQNTLHLMEYQKKMGRVHYLIVLLNSLTIVVKNLKCWLTSTKMLLMEYRNYLTASQSIIHNPPIL